MEVSIKLSSLLEGGRGMVWVCGEVGGKWVQYGGRGCCRLHSEEDREGLG